MVTDSGEDSESWMQLQCRIGNRFADRLNKHILSVERMDKKKIAKHKWVEEAIQRKLEREKNLHPADIPKESRLALKIPKSLSDQIDDRVDFMRPLRNTYSKNKWVVEAIEEKLEEEGQRVALWRNSHPRSGSV